MAIYVAQTAVFLHFCRTVHPIHFVCFFLQIMKVETVHERGAKNKQKVSDKVPFYTNNENVIICLTKTKKVNRFKTFFAYLQSHLNNQPSARSLQNPNICKQI